MTNNITANDLKTGGVSAIRKNISDNSEVIISVRGKESYVIMDMEKYNYLRECELEAALIESKKDIMNGRYIEESVQDHIKRLIGG
jgi:PHD/YefM family antitoxin component YafN of YafNO toxin-antitoxin module